MGGVKCNAERPARPAQAATGGQPMRCMPRHNRYATPAVHHPSPVPLAQHNPLPHPFQLAKRQLQGIQHWLTCRSTTLTVESHLHNTARDRSALTAKLRRRLPPATAGSGQGTGGGQGDAGPARHGCGCSAGAAPCTQVQASTSRGMAPQTQAPALVTMCTRKLRGHTPRQQKHSVIWHCALPRCRPTKQPHTSAHLARCG